jgi:hypothetical protein
MAPEAPPIESVPTPGGWTDAPSALTGGFLLSYARRMDAVFPFPVFERIVRFIWNRVQHSQRADLVLEVKNCGWIINISGIDFYRMADGSYLNFDDPIRMGTGASMHYRLRTEGRSVIVGDSVLMAPRPLNMAEATIRLELTGGQSDYWLSVCGELPALADLDGAVCE